MRCHGRREGESPTAGDRDVCLVRHGLDLPAVPHRRARMTQHAAEPVCRHQVEVELRYAVPAAREPDDVTRPDGGVELRPGACRHELSTCGKATLLSEEPDDVCHPSTLTTDRAPVQCQSTGPAA